MTMPSERTRALVSAAAFLQELRSGTDTPAAIREQAIRVLRHFPEARSIEQEAERQLHRQQESGKSSWLMPVDHYERPKPEARTIEPSDAAHPVTDLKGIFGKPKKTVSIEEMNAAIAATAARAGRCPINMSMPTDIPTTGLSAYIADLAKHYGVEYVNTGGSALAEVITRLAGDDVKPDETEKLVIALRRANLIDGNTMVTLLGRYFDETRKEGRTTC